MAGFQQSSLVGGLLPDISSFTHLTVSSSYFIIYYLLRVLVLVPVLVLVLVLLLLTAAR